MKVTGSYAALAGGVSQQPPHLRQTGQHTDQINMLSDPVNGLVRRHGSRYIADISLSLLGSGTPAIDAAGVLDTVGWQTFQYQHQGEEFALCVRRGVKPPLSELPGMVVFNKTTGAFVPLITNPTDTALNSMLAAGVTAITAVGRYVFMAGGGNTTALTLNDVYNTPSNQGMSAVWIKGGAYAKTYTVTATLLNDTVITFSYTTPTSSYPGTLDTTKVPLRAGDAATGGVFDIEAAFIKESSPGVFRAELTWWEWSPSVMRAFNNGTTPANELTNVYPAAITSATQFSYNPTGGGAFLGGDRYIYFHPSLATTQNISIYYQHFKTVPNPNYTNIVSDIQSKYNNDVNQWILAASKAIVPENIADALMTAAITAGIPSAARSGSHLYFTNVKALSVSDGGDDSLILGVANVVPSPEKLSPEHFVGKVVRVRTSTESTAYYFRAVPRDTVSIGFTDVTWVETAGVVQSLSGGIFTGVVVGGSFYLASSASLLAGLTPGDHPVFASSAAGDTKSVKPPHFAGRRITYLGVFQDRLLVGADAVLSVSATGDYLNFYRGTMLTVRDDAPFELLSQGSEDDTLKYSVLYNKNIVLIGDVRQYAISGTVPLTPANANFPVLSNHRATTLCHPRAVGNSIYYAQTSANVSSLHQLQPSGSSGETESFPVSAHIESYIQGAIVEIQDFTRPTMLCVRTRQERRSLYTYAYVDAPGRERVVSAWSKWTFSESLGHIIGIGQHPDGVLVFSLVTAPKFDASGFATWVVAHVCPTQSGLPTVPYLDAWRPWSTVLTSTGHLHPQTPGDWSAAYDTSTVWAYLGDTLIKAPDTIAAYPLASGLVVGANFPAAVTLTRPFVSDRQGLPLNVGSLVVNNLTVTTQNSGGMMYTVTAPRGVSQYVYNARRMGDPDNEVERVPINSLNHKVVVMDDAGTVQVTLSARRWLPFTISSVEWVGQFYNRPQRV